MLRRLPLAAILFFLGCNAPDPYHAQAQEKVERMKEGASARKTLDSLQSSMKFAYSVSGSYDYSDTSGYPDTEARYPARLLTAGPFHADEVDSSALEQTWYGLFRGAEGYYVKQTGIKAERIEDVVLDEEGQRTGWEIATAVPDSSVVLLSGVEGVREGAVEVIALPKQQLLPGEELSFNFRGDTYKLFATGDVQKDEGETVTKNYKLFLQARIGGKLTNQLLVAHPALEEAMAQILFAGDLNGDGQPDLLLDTTWHYNAVVPTLYLSVPGARGNLLELVALHLSVGC